MHTHKTHKYRRGAIRRDAAKPVLILFPSELIDGIDEAVSRLDTDRSKFVRNAVRNQLAELYAATAAAK